MLAIFEAPGNLTLPAFAKLCGRLSHQINGDVHGRRLLALSLGNHGQRISDWQLDPVSQAMVREVMVRAEGIDVLTLYRVISEPLAGLDWKALVDAVAPSNIEHAVHSVCVALRLTQFR